MQINSINYMNNREYIKGNMYGKNNEFSTILSQMELDEDVKNIINNYNVTLHKNSLNNISINNREINNVLISDATLKKISKNSLLKSKVLKHIEAVSSKKWLNTLRSLMPPVKNAGVIINKDGSALYWIESDTSNDEGENTNQVKHHEKSQVSMGFQNMNIMSDDHNVITEITPELLVKKYIALNKKYLKDK